MTDMKNINECLELLLNKEKYEVAKNGLKYFNMDDVFLDKLQGKLNQTIKQPSNYGNIGIVIDIVENILGAEYKISTPQKLCMFYNDAVDKSQFASYAVVREHFNALHNIESSILDQSVTEMTLQSGRYIDRNGTPTQPFMPIEGLYVALIRSILANNDTKYLRDTTDLLKQHFESLKDSGFNLSRLIEKGYIKEIITSAVDIKKPVDVLKDKLNTVLTIMTSLDKKGFDLYHAGTIDTIREYLKADSINKLDKVAEYCNRNTMILNLKLRLKE